MQTGPASTKWKNKTNTVSSSASTLRQSLSQHLINLNRMMTPKKHHLMLTFPCQCAGSAPSPSYCLGNVLGGGNSEIKGVNASETPRASLQEALSLSEIHIKILLEILENVSYGRDLASSKSSFVDPCKSLRKQTGKIQTGCSKAAPSASAAHPHSQPGSATLPITKWPRGMAGRLVLSWNSLNGPAGKQESRGKKALPQGCRLTSLHSKDLSYKTNS